jgi:hypothetical protein
VFTDESGEEVSASKDLLIDHGTPINVSSLSCPGEGSVGSEIEIALAFSDLWGNPVDNAKHNRERHLHGRVTGQWLGFHNR